MGVEDIFVGGFKRVEIELFLSFFGLNAKNGNNDIFLVQVVDENFQVRKIFGVFLNFVYTQFRPLFLSYFRSRLCKEEK